MNTADKFESARKLLEWSFEYLATKLGKYTPEFLERVHRGKPMPEVEDDLHRVYVEALAKRAVDSILRSEFPERVHAALTRRFIEFVQGKNLPLGDVSTLSLRVSEGGFRELLTKDPDAIVVNWEGVLEDIVRELNKAQQGRLLWDNSRAADISSHSSLVSGVPTIAGGPRRDPLAVQAECNTCHKPRPKDRYSEQTCACVNDDYL